MRSIGTTVLGIASVCFAVEAGIIAIAGEVLFEAGSILWGTGEIILQLLKERLLMVLQCQPS